MSAVIHQGDWIEVLRTLPDCSVHCVVTSPPYWGLRDYGVAGQLGLERTPEEYVAKMVEGFREVRRVLRDDGTCWVNLGDSYAGAFSCARRSIVGQGSPDESTDRPNRLVGGLKEKDLVGIPWMVAFALRSDGWYLRQDIIWAKPNPMPESVTDRCTKSHEYIFLLTKNARYWYDADAVREESQDVTNKHTTNPDGSKQIRKAWTDHKDRDEKSDLASWGSKYGSLVPANGRNKRSVWNVATSPFPEAHFATFPPKLVEPCIMAGCPIDGTVLDPFCGAGTTGMVAKRLMRSFVGIELNPQYVEMARRRIEGDAPLFNEVSTFAQEITR